MSKILILLFALMPVMFAATCADIPSFKKLKEQLSSISSDTLNNAINTFENAKAATQTGLDFCSDFNDKSGCCTSTFITAAKDAIEKSTEKLKAKKPIYGILLNQLEQSIKRCRPKGNAPGKKLRILEDAAKPEDAIKPEDKSPKDDKNFVAQYKQCQLKIIKATRKFKRGAFCTLCIDPEKINDYFESDGTLKMNTASFDEYKKEMGEGFKCLSDFNDAFVAKVKEATALLDANTCPKVQEKIQAQLDSFKLCTGDQCLSFWLDRVRLFGDAVAEAAVKEETDVPDINGGRREMNAGTGDIVSSPNGYKAYISDSTDNNVAIDGVTLGGNKLFYYGILALLALFALLF